jgi:general secretion pathway protein D
VKKLLCLVLLAVSTTSCLSLDERALHAHFDLQNVAVSQVVNLVYLEALKQPYVIEPAVLKDDRLVSFRLDASETDFKRAWATFLDSLGFVVETRSGIDIVTLRKAEPAHRIDDVLVYRPRFRTVAYLVDTVGAFFRSGAFAVQRAVKARAGEAVPTDAAPTTAAATIQTESDVLVFSGSDDEVGRLKRMLAQVDTPIGDVLVSAVVFEVTTSHSDATAFSLALSLLGGRFGVGLGSGVTTLANALTVKSTSIDAAFSALAGDSRFKAISTPTVRVRSGTEARLMVGQDVPTLGAVTYPQAGGAAVQSIEYRSSGVIFGLTPTVRDGAIDVVIDQQISDFAKTETGVDGSPTLTKRSLSTSTTLSDGEVVLLGGLTTRRLQDQAAGLSFLPRFLRSSSASDDQTEILLLMQVSRVPTNFAR